MTAKVIPIRLALPKPKPVEPKIELDPSDEWAQLLKDYHGAQ